MPLLPEFQTADVGRVMMTAEALKAQKRQSATDALRDKYLGLQIDNAQSGEVRAKETHETEKVKRQAQTDYLLAQEIENAPDPKAAMRDFNPDFIRDFDAKFGAGMWDALPPEKAKQIAGEVKTRSAALAGISLRGTPEQQFAAANAQENAATAFDRQKELEGLKHQNELEQIDRTGKYATERAGVTNERRTFKDIQALRKEYEDQAAVKNYKAVLPVINSARRAPDTGYGDLDLIYATGKILDPNSVVREGELALTIAAGSPLQRLLGTTRFSIEGGGRLTKKSRQQLIGMLEGRVGSLADEAEAERQRYAGYAQENGWSADQVVGAARGGQGGPTPQQPRLIHPTNAQGWKLMRDAQGNQAYVSPDGTQFEEIR